MGRVARGHARPGSGRSYAAVARSRDHTGAERNRAGAESQEVARPTTRNAGFPICTSPQRSPMRPTLKTLVPALAVSLDAGGVRKQLEQLE